MNKLITELIDKNYVKAIYKQGQIHYARKFEYYAFERPPKKPSIMPEIMLEKYSIMLT